MPYRRSTVPACRRTGRHACYWAGPQKYGGKAEVVKPTQGAGGKDHPLHAIVSVLNREFRGRGKDIAATERLIRIFERQDAEHRNDHNDEYNAHKDAPSSGQTSSARQGSGGEDMGRGQTTAARSRQPGGGEKIRRVRCSADREGNRDEGLVFATLDEKQN